MLTAASLVLMCATASGFDDSIHLTLVPKGASAKAGGYYMPQKVNLSDQKPASLKKAPDGLKSPRYAELPIGKGGSKTLVILDESVGSPAKLFVDTNGNGDLTDDQPTEWAGKPAKAKDQDQAFTTFYGGAMVSIGDSAKATEVHLLMYRFDPTDPSKAANKDVLLYYRDYGYEGEVKIGDKSYKALLLDEKATGDFRGGEKDAKSSGVNLLVDVNADGKFDSRRESFDSKKPFNVGGTTYELAGMTKSGDAFKIVKSKETVAEVPAGPDHGVGKKITAFEAKDFDGKMVKFPGDYKGKVVMLDFWATWCHPCMMEMPNVVKTYKKFHDKGFDIQGISLDNETSIAKMPDVMKEQGMTWRQVADAKGWKAEIALKFDIHSIPATMLVDGDSGEILGVNLRGEDLGAAVEKALSKKKGKS